MAEHKIIHISDLHFDEKGNSLLQNSEFLDAFLESLKKLDKTVDTLIISGDIVDRGGCSFSRKMQNIFASFAKTYFKNRKRTF